MSTIECTLYYADWCGHCKQFEPEWDKFVSQIEPNKRIQTKKYEDSHMTKVEKANAKINGTGIRGFPTIKIKIIENCGKSTEYEYGGKRLSDDLIKHIGDIMKKS